MKIFLILLGTIFIAAAYARLSYDNELPINYLETTPLNQNQSKESTSITADVNKKPLCDIDCSSIDVVNKGEVNITENTPIKSRPETISKDINDVGIADSDSFDIVSTSLLKESINSNEGSLEEVESTYGDFVYQPLIAQFLADNETLPEVNDFNHKLNLKYSTPAVDEDGTSEPIVKTLSSFLEDGDIYLFSLNNFYFNDEGVFILSFLDGIVSFGSFGTSTYEVNENILFTPDGSEVAADEFIYISDELALFVPVADKDLGVMSHLEFGVDGNYLIDQDWVENDFKGETFYLIFDDQLYGSLPIPTLIKLSFSDSDVTITKNGVSFSVAWSINENGYLNLNTSEEYGRDWVYAKSINNEDMALILDTEKTEVSVTIMVSNEYFAEDIINKWSALNN